MTEIVIRLLDIPLIVIALLGAAAVVFAVCCHVRSKRLVRGIDKMLDSAIDGSFSESSFNETELSYLENKLFRYLSSSEISARKTAAEKEKIKSLIADISHQTKTPISNIRLYSELLSEGELPSTTREYAERISMQSEKLSFLITSLVKLSRLETGVIALSPKEADVYDMLEEVAAQAEPAAAAKGLGLTLKNAHEKAVFDERWTHEALWNIVDNAIKYTECGEVKISVRKTEMFLCIEISDTGRGIPESEQAQIFSRFYRSDSSSRCEGLGIGLYLARHIISAQNGYIKLASEEGKGSAFSVFLSKL